MNILELGLGYYALFVVIFMIIMYIIYFIHVYLKKKKAEYLDKLDILICRLEDAVITKECYRDPEDEGFSEYNNYIDEKYERERNNLITFCLTGKFNDNEEGE